MDFIAQLESRKTKRPRTCLRRWPSDAARFVFFQLMRTRAEVHSVHDLMEESRRQGRRAAKALEDASATRSVLLPRLRDAQVRVSR